jgi:AAHS family 4-hydroxybenzoate transporter-like MFS transporter
METSLHSLTTSDIAEIIDRSALGPLQIRILLICLLVAVLDGYDTQCIAFVAPHVATEWALTRSAFAGVFSAGLVGTMMGSLFLAPLGDKFGRKSMLLSATCWFGAGSLLTPLAHNLPSLMLFRTLTGLGLGMALPNAIALAVEYSPQRRRTFLTTAVVLGISLGGILGGIVSAQVIPEFGWRSIFVLGGTLPLLSIPLLWLYLPDSIRFMASQQQSSSEVRSSEIRSILHQIDSTSTYHDARVLPTPGDARRRAPVGRLFAEGRALRTGLLWCVFIANLFMMNFMINWLPSVLHQAGLPIKQSILATTLFNIAGIVGGLILAQSVDKWGAYKILPASYLLTAISVCSVGLFYHCPAALWIAVSCSGAGIIGTFSGVNVLSGAVYPTDIRTTGVGWAFGVGRVGSVLGPAAGGLVVAWGWSTRDIFIVGAVPAIFAAVGILGMGRWADQ